MDMLPIQYENFTIKEGEIIQKMHQVYLHHKWATQPRWDDSSKQKNDKTMFMSLMKPEIWKYLQWMS